MWIFSSNYVLNADSVTPRQKFLTHFMPPISFYTLENIRNLMSESLFNKVAGLKACNFIKKRLAHFLKIFSEGLERNQLHQMC